MRFHLVLAGTLGMLACDPPPTDGPTRDTLVSEDVGTPVRATVGAGGGVVESTQAGVTYRLAVPAGALEAETEISLTPARMVGVDGSVGAHLEPDGLQFLAPATLTITPPPAGEVLVALQDGAIPVEAVLAIPLVDGVLLPVLHFSTHAAADAQAAQSVLPADVLQAVQGLTGLSREEVGAIALGVFYATHVEPLLPLSARDVRGFDIASAAALSWLSAVAGAGDDVRELPHVRNGEETVEALAATVTADLIAAGRELYGRVTLPSCSGTPDILSVFDWGRVSVLLQTRLATLGESVTPGTCLTSRATVTGPTSMTATTRELNFRLGFEVQGPASDPRIAPSDASFTIDALGATGPTEIEDGNGGDVRNVVFVREPGPNRARVVTLTVNALSVSAQLEAIPTPEPAIFTVAEVGTAVTLTAAPTLLERPSETAQVCASVTLDDQAVDEFTARFTREGPGSISADVVATLDGIACTTYTPPSPLPQAGAEVIIRALVPIGGGQLLKSTAITLGSGGVQVALVATPGSADADGQILEVCGTVTSDGTPVTEYDVQFALTGPGQISEAGVISVTTFDGEVCIDWTAPTPLVVGGSATVSAHATVEGLSADGNVVIPFADAPPPPTSIFDGRWVGTASYTWSKTIENGSPNNSAITAQNGSGTFDVACTLSPPEDASANRISDCALTNHTGTATFSLTRHQGPFLCDIVAVNGGTCTTPADCIAPESCLADPQAGDRCALCLGTGFRDELTTHTADFDFPSIAIPDSMFQIVAEAGEHRVFWQNPRAPVAGHFSSTSTCSTSGPNCSGATTPPTTNMETDLGTLDLPSVVFTDAMDDVPTTLAPGGSISGSIEMPIGTASFNLSHVP